MRTIAFITQKGGAGKSTLATNVAVAASLAGEQVVLLDLDGSQSAASWSKIRGRSDVAVESVPAAKLALKREALEKRGVTLLVIDAPGGAGPEFDAAVRAADLCVIPARPNAFDLWASEHTRARIKALGKDHAFLLNQCPPAPQSQRVRQAPRFSRRWGRSCLRSSRRASIIRKRRALDSQSSNATHGASPRARSRSFGLA